MGYTKEDLRMFSFFDDKSIKSTLDFLTGVINRENIISIYKRY